MTRRFAVAAALLALAPPARGDGAFPDGMQLLLAADRPRSIALGTNFGVVLSDDAGASWRWSCEQVIAPYPSRFAVGAPPDDTLFAVTPSGLFSSRDGACSFGVATRAGAAVYVADAFPDPTDAKRVLAIWVPMLDGGQQMVLAESRDGGLTLGDALYTAPPGVVLTGVECARADPKVIYLAQLDYNTNPARPSLLRSSDGGASFVAHDESAFVGGQTLRIAAVDPVKPDTIYLQVSDVKAQSIAISDDGGATLRVPVTHAPNLSAFVRRASGTLIVGALDGARFVSTDGGMTFATAQGARLRALAERDGVLYGAADDFADGFAVGTSPDDGATWKPLLRFQDLCGVIDCAGAHAACDKQWPQLVSLLGIEPAAACYPDGGAPGDMSNAPPPTPKAGCHCDVGRRPSNAWPAIVVAALGLLRFRFRFR